MALTPDELKKELASGKNETGKKCPVCGEILSEDREEVRTMEEREVCIDCYFDALGDFVEKNPIRKLGIRGPAS